MEAAEEGQARRRQGALALVLQRGHRRATSVHGAGARNATTLFSALKMKRRSRPAPSHIQCCFVAARALERQPHGLVVLDLHSSLVYVSCQQAVVIDPPLTHHQCWRHGLARGAHHKTGGSTASASMKERKLRPKFFFRTRSRAPASRVPLRAARAHSVARAPGADRC